MGQSHEKAIRPDFSSRKNQSHPENPRNPPNLGKARKNDGKSSGWQTPGKLLKTQHSRDVKLHTNKETRYKVAQ